MPFIWMNPPLNPAVISNQDNPAPLDPNALTLKSLPDEVTENVAGHMQLKHLAMLRQTAKQFRKIKNPNPMHEMKQCNELNALLMNMPNLKSLEITDSELTDAHLQKIDSFEFEVLIKKIMNSNLSQVLMRELKVRGCKQITDEGLRALGSIGSLTSTWLDLRKCSGITGAGLNYLGQLRGMKELKLDGRNFKENDLRPIKWMTKLDHLELRNLQAENLRLFSYLAPLKKLKSLEIDITPDSGLLASGDGSRFDAISGMEDLESLCIMIGNEGNDIGEEKFLDGDLAHICTMTQLTSLNFNAGNVSDAGLTQLSQLSDLEDLELYRVDSQAPWEWLLKLDCLDTLKINDLIDLGDDQLDPLEGPAIRNFEFINNFDHEMTGHFMRHLPKSIERVVLTNSIFPVAALVWLQELPALSTLHLDCRMLGPDEDSDWNDEVLPFLNAMPALKTLNVAGREFSKEAIAQLRRNKPELVIIT